MDILNPDLVSTLNISSLYTTTEFLIKHALKYITEVLEVFIHIGARVAEETTEWVRTSAERFLERNQVPPQTCCVVAIAVLVAVMFIWCISIGGKQIITDPVSPGPTEVISIFELAKTAYLPGRADQVKALVSKLQFDVNFPIPKSGMTLFLCACISGQKDLVSFLLDRGGDVSVTNKDGDTCLYLTTFASAGSPSRDLSTLQLLIEAGCNVNAQNCKGNTALHWAASNGDVNIIKLLLNNGADPNVRNSIGMYPIGMATNAGYLRAGKLLKISLPDPGTPWDMFEPQTPVQVRLGLLSPPKDHLALSPRPRMRLDLSERDHYCRPQHMGVCC